MSDKDLQRVTESLSDIGQAPTHQNPSLLHPVDRSFPKLTPKEEIFCLAIVDGKNQSDAYRHAYKPKRAKEKTIHEKASRIMARGKVRTRIAELMASMIAETQMSRTEWLKWLTKCCRFDPRKMFDTNGKPKPITELEENEAAAIAGFEVHGELQGSDDSGKAIGVRIRIKLVSRLDALALLGKACHYYADRQEQTGSDGGPTPQNLTVKFVDASQSPAEVYQRMLKGA